jgi:hypothetical protein
MPTKETTEKKLTPKRKTTKLQYCLSEKEKKNLIKKRKLEEKTKIQHLQ